MLLIIESSLEIAQVLVLSYDLLQTSSYEIIDLRLIELLAMATQSVCRVKWLSLLVEYILIHVPKIYS